MKKIQFVQCVDVHIGMPFSSLKSVPGLPEKRRSHIENSFYNIVHKACEKQAFLLICGDLFEEKTIVKSVIDNINFEFGKVPYVVMIPGNHDPYHAGSFTVVFMGENVRCCLPTLCLLPEAQQPSIITIPVGKHQLHDLKLNKDTSHLIVHGTIDTICTDDRYWP